MRTIVLGGTRFIGRAVVDELVDAGHDVLIVHRGVHEPEGLPDVAHLHAHRRDLARCAGELRRFRPDGVIDMCAMTRSDADIALAALPEGPRLVAVSSINVYRACASVSAGTVTDAVPLTEASPVRDAPLREEVMDGYDYDPSEYENLDVEAAYLARGAAVCRLPVVYGPHDFKRREDFVLRRVRAGRSRLPVGAGGFLCSRGFAPELARGMRLALEHPGAAGEVFNLCEAQCAPLRLWVEQIIASAGGELALVRVPADALPEDLELTGDIAQPWLTSPAKAQAVLGWVHRSPADCVRESVRWHMRHPPTTSDTGFDADDRALALATASSGARSRTVGILTVVPTTLDPAQFGVEGTGGAPSPEALALLATTNVVLDAAGVADINAGRIDPRIVAVLAELSRTHKITVSAMSSDHPSFTTGGAISNHYLGRGMDIAAIDGVAITVSHAVARGIASDLASLDPSFRPDEIGTPWAISGPGYFTDADHQDKIHVAFKRAIDPWWRPPA